MDDSAGQNATAQDEKLYRREAMRLEMSLKDAARMADGRPIFAMMHYPPLLPETLRQGTEFTRLLSEYGVKRCVYGHLHGQSVQRGFSGNYRGCVMTWFPATRWGLRSRMCRWKARKAEAPDK